MDLLRKLGMGFFKKNLITISISFAVVGCSAVDVYTTAKNINDDTFKTAANRFCGETAFLAANRYLTDAEIVKRYEFCDLYRARK